MYWTLAIDFGTSFTCAAVAHGGTREPLPIEGSTQIPSAVAVIANTVMVGGAAFDHGLRDPASAAYDLKARIADPGSVAVTLGRGTALRDWDTVELLGHLLSYIGGRACAAMGGYRPAALVLTHPVGWGPTAQARLREAARLAALPSPRLLDEATAAALHLADRNPPPPGRLLAVLDIGAGTCDGALLRHSRHGFQPVAAQGLNWLGGRHFDRELLRIIEHHVRTENPDRWDEILADNEPVDGRATRFAALALVDAINTKHDLSTSQSCTVVIPGLPRTEVRILQSEFERSIGKSVDSAIGLLGDLARSAGASSDQIGTVVLAGGSSRIPLLKSRVHATYGKNRTVVADPAHAKHAVALGALIGVPGSEANPKPRAGYRAVPAQPEGTPPVAPPERMVLTLGDISVTLTKVLTPAGEFPLVHCQWHVTSTVKQSKRTPRWALWAAFLLAIPTSLISLLLLFYRETVVRGEVHVTVTSGPTSHTARIPVDRLGQVAAVEASVARLSWPQIGRS